MAKALPHAWFNGRFMPLAEVSLSPLDRGFLFADAVYEVIPVFGGRPFLLEPHLRRLARSLGELHIRNPHDDAAWKAIVEGLVEGNGSGTMAVYLQVSRGADDGRDHGFPDATLSPTVFGMASPIPDPHPDQAGIAAITHPDTRWARCDIKSTALLPNLLARQVARQAGAGEALLLRDGILIEGSSSSVLIVEQGAICRRPPGDHAALPGTTTEAVVTVARAVGIPCNEAPVSEARLRAADEIWIAAATRGVVPVVRLDGTPVGDGEPGPVWRKVAAAFEVLKRGRRR